MMIVSLMKENTSAYSFRSPVYCHHGGTQWQAGRHGAGGVGILQLDMKETGSGLSPWVWLENK